jgi:hypothetical protein
MIDELILEKRELFWSQGYWEIPNGLDITGFDFDWRPFKYDRPYIHQFGTQHQKTGGPKFVIPNNEGIKYQDFQKAIAVPNKENRCWRPLVNNATIDFSWHPDETEPPFIYVFGNQWYDAELMPTYQYRVKGATQKKYVNDIKATLLPNKDNWEIPEDIEDGFDYTWVPNPYEPKFIWQFGTQHQRTGGPKFIVESATTVKYSEIQKAFKKPNLKNWRIIEPIETDKFDFSWHPDETERDYNFIFGNQFHSSEHMPTVMYKNKNSTGNKYSNSIKASLKIDAISYEDSIFDAMASHKLDTKYTYIGNVPQNYKIIEDDEIPHVHLIDNIAAIVPNDIKKFVYDKLYDSPYIKRHDLGYKNKPLDIVFLSNGEQGAEENYEHLLSLVKGLPNNIIGLKDIKGRVASQHEAANMANTPWYFLINGKCKVNPDFDFSWQPDRMCTARHYIFRATNPINNLEYGHMAIVANNKRLTLNTTGKGLDFTLDSPHAIVNVNSGVGMFNTSSWDTWRTSFREVIKLKHNVETFNDKASKERLHIWTTVANGDFAEWALRGANDAVKYYESVNGDFDSLKLSYDWAWLKTKFDTYRP